MQGSRMVPSVCGNYLVIATGDSIRVVMIERAMVIRDFYAEQAAVDRSAPRTEFLSEHCRGMAHALTIAITQARENATADRRKDAPR